MVYLTADSDKELETLERGKVYVLGGIVDRNRHKGICSGKAAQLGVQTAKLPLGRYVRLGTSQARAQLDPIASVHASQLPPPRRS